MSVFLIFLIVINAVGGIIFAFDKFAARRGRNRISEKKLHLLEIAGSIFSIWSLMYILHHKNRKSGYYILTYIILAIWSVFIIYLIKFTQAIQ